MGFAHLTGAVSSQSIPPIGADMSALFSSSKLRDLELANRIVVSPMCQYASEDGRMNDWHLMHLGQFAIGAGGLIFTEATHVSPEGRISPKCAGLWNDAQEADMKRVIDFCRQHGVAALGIQLAHAGRKASTHPPLDGGRPLQDSEGAWQTVAPSPHGFAPDWPESTALDRAGMDKVTSDFVEATKRSARIGFDTVELHIGHGYLLNQFFSPLSNLRDDAYGGTLENRMRFPLEVFEAVRAAWPQNKPLGVRISAFDWVDGGTSVDDTIAFSQALEKLGCDYIDITSGGVDHRQAIVAGPGYQVDFAAAVKKAISIPVMAVGMITEAEQAEAIIANGDADFVMLARGMMDDPHWAWHAAAALGADTAYPAQYRRCSPAFWKQDRKV